MAVFFLIVMLAIEPIMFFMFVMSYLAVPMRIMSVFAPIAIAITIAITIVSPADCPVVNVAIFKAFEGGPGVEVDRGAVVVMVESVDGYEIGLTHVIVVEDVALVAIGIFVFLLDFDCFGAGGQS